MSWLKVRLAQKAGFCFGVKNAIDKTKQNLLNKEKVYCLGELVHNKQVTKELEKMVAQRNKEYNKVFNEARKNSVKVMVEQYRHQNPNCTEEDVKAFVKDYLDFNKISKRTKDVITLHSYLFRLCK